MAIFLDAVQQVVACPLPIGFVRWPRGSRNRFVERLRHHSTCEVSWNLALSAALELSQKEAVFEAPPQCFQSQGRQGTGVDEHAVAVAPIGSPARSLVERD